MPPRSATSTDKLLPCLFDRLIDDDVENKQEARAARVMSWPDYRTAVLRDLNWLLNCNNHLGNHLPIRKGIADSPDAEYTVLEIADFPEVEKSVLNFGKASLSGLHVSGLSLQDLELEIARAVRNFEPRINGDTLVVRQVEDLENGYQNALSFEIQGDLWARSVPDKLFIKTALDLETGAVTVG